MQETIPKFKIGDTVGAIHENVFLITTVLVVAQSGNDVRYGIATQLGGDVAIGCEKTLWISLHGRGEKWFDESRLFADPRKMDAFTLAQTLFCNDALYKEWLGNQIGPAMENDKSVIRVGDRVALKGCSFEMTVGSFMEGGNIARCWFPNYVRDTPLLLTPPEYKDVDIAALEKI